MVVKTHANNPVLRNPKFAKDVFDSARRPLAWLTVGCRLRSAADAIFERENPVATRFYDELRRISNSEKLDEAKFPPPNFDAAYMLIAFAIENLLKGLIVAKERVTFSRQKMPGNLVTHDLHKLHKLAAPGATISQHVLDSLTYMAEWRGRYPLPLSVEKFWPMHDDGAPKIAVFSWPNAHSEFLAYFDCIEAELRNLL
jgi:hypothetical protein